MRATISSTRGPTRSVELDTGTYVLGRDPGCDVALEDPDVSRRHARLDVAPSGAWLVDLGSTNGTSIAGRPVSEPVWLPAPSEFRLGTTTVRLAPDGTAPDDHTRRVDVPATGPSGLPPPPAAPASPPAAPGGSRVAGAGPVAGGDVVISGGRDAAGRDLVIHEGFRLRSRMRAPAKHSIRLGVVLLLVGMGLVGYFVIAWNNEIFDALTEPTAKPPSDLPSPLPWLPLGFGLTFLGIVLVVVGLLLPRDKVVTKDDR